ncbi:tyrosine-protein phosphatase [Amycolatopsis sp. NPDC049688]|uniref:tyrosine-protein phosphatase n=1 Tax=Amycolatopsis sp. NPDC049688 TaxID=3154733 RepID=UPI00343F1964
MNGPRWVDLEGADNVRDIGPLTTVDGQEIRPGRVLRGDDLRDLTPADVRRLLGEFGVRHVIDLRSTEEAAAGSGPLAGARGVRTHHLSLFPEPGADTSAAKRRVLELLPPGTGTPVTAHYLAFLHLRPDSFVAALQTLAHADGPVIVHCSAGKDRTAAVIAFALELAGVPRDVIVEDYLLTGERMPRIVARWERRRQGAGRPFDARPPQAETLRCFLRILDEHFDGPRGWLRRHGWSAADETALRAKLLE